MGLAPTSLPILEEEIVRFTVARRLMVTHVFVLTNAPALNSGARDGLAHGLMDRGKIACTATDAHDATLHVRRCSCDD